MITEAPEYIPDQVRNWPTLSTQNRPFSIFAAASAGHYARGRRIIEDYQRWLGVDLCFQNFEAELESLETMYGPPRGALLLAEMDGEDAGCVALRDLGAGIAEMKRLYVAPDYRGLGIGRALTEEFISKARAMGYSAIRLDTIPRLGVAYTVYQKFGFKKISPYTHNPIPDAIFLELTL
ncbi:MAG TPA: GNAT family N-acetyltransferase [Planctomycetota bacterium]|jgi:GNAT superfamily N-acetyltransferase|nr:GNAT family N-acetyltransferase [Planctomycetota bacterium]